MPQYLLSVFQDDEAPLPPPEDIPGIIEAVGAVQAEMKDAGVWVFMATLTDAGSATVVRGAADGGVSMTDGPFIEAREHLGGFTVIDVPDLDTALEWARKGSAACTWPVEVRPVADGPPEP